MDEAKNGECDDSYFVMAMVFAATTAIGVLSVLVLSCRGNRKAILQWKWRIFGKTRRVSHGPQSNRNNSVHSQKSSRKSVTSGLVAGAPVVVNGQLKVYKPDMAEKVANEDNQVLAFKSARKPSVRNLWNLTKDQRETYAWEIDFNEITLLTQLASGNFGLVHKGMWLGSEVAIKIPLQNLPADYYGHFLREVQLMTTLHHPNIVVFMGACITQPNICLVMEFLRRGCMYDFLREKDTFSECSVYYRSWYQLVVKFATDVARGMQYLHRRCKIIQRDLKSRNLLIDEFYNVKVCDFGLSRTHDPRGNNGRRSSASYDNTLTACGTPFWTAPEVIRNEAYNHSADVYSYAIVLYECYTRSEPYTDQSAPAMEIAYHVAEEGLRPTVPEETPKHLRELMEDCWHEKAHKRPKFQEILERLFVMKKGLQNDPTGLTIDQFVEQNGGMTAVIEGNNGASEDGSGASSKSKSSGRQKSVGEFCERELYPDSPKDGRKLSVGALNGEHETSPSEGSAVASSSSTDSGFIKKDYATEPANSSSLQQNPAAPMSPMSPLVPGATMVQHSSPKPTVVKQFSGPRSLGQLGGGGAGGGVAPLGSAQITRRRSLDGNPVTMLGGAGVFTGGSLQSNFPGGLGGTGGRHSFNDSTGTGRHTSTDGAGGRGSMIFESKPTSPPPRSSNSGSVVFTDPPPVV